jgi:hypothetical protein
VALGFDKLLRHLTQEGVEFLLIGANAAIAQGVPIGTLDLDLCYRHTKINCTRLATVLRAYHPRLRGAPDGLPFRCDGPTLFAGSNFTFATDVGDVDIFGHVTGVGGYDGIAKHALTIEFLGFPVLVMSLEDLAKSKKAAGRPKDKFHLTHIEATLRLRKKRRSSGSEPDS